MRENQGRYYDFHERETQIGNVAGKDLDYQRAKNRLNSSDTKSWHAVPWTTGTRDADYNAARG